MNVQCFGIEEKGEGRKESEEKKKNETERE
jgi:hypothetical protein